MSDFEAGWRGLIAGKTAAWWAFPARAGLGLLSALYGGAVRTGRAGYDLGLFKPERLPCAVVSVGNITVGGTGKTTTVRWLARRLQEWGLRPAILSHGYRAAAARRDRDAVTIVAGPEGVRAPVEESGDEPQLLARSVPGVPVLAGRRRVHSGRRAWEEFQVDACLLDDGFQYRRLHKDLELVLVDATEPFGYGRLLPAGALREPLSGLRRADAAIITHASSADEERRAWVRRELKRWNPRMVLAEARHTARSLRDAVTGASRPLGLLRGGNWTALSSLGRPESFERTLANLGAGAVAAARFPDHHPYTEAEVRRVSARTAAEGRPGIVTTEKDLVKIAPEWLGGGPWFVLEVDLEFLCGQDALEALLRERIHRPTGSAGDAEGSPK